MFAYILGFTLLGVVCGFLFELCNKDKNPVLTVIASGIVLGIVNCAIIYLGMPSFSHPLSGGWPLLFFFNIFGAALIVLLFGVSDYDWQATGGGVGFGIGFVLLAVYLLVCAFTPPAFCNDAQIKEQFEVLNLEPATEPYHLTKLDEMIRVPESVALSKAGNILSSGENAALGNYLQARRAYIQNVAGEVYYVINLKVTDWIAFRQAGGLVPGYLLVSATDQNAQVEFRTGYQFKYAPTARGELDLDRRVYLDFLLGTNLRVADLDGMEIDDSFNPVYVGTLMSHFMGYKGMKPTGLIFFDPTTGENWQTSLDEKPDWLDRIYPLSWEKEYVGLWARFSNHKTCSFSKLGEEQLDWGNDVVTPEGVEYQFTITSMGVEPSLTKIVSFNPRTGEGKFYSTTGKTIQGITTLVEQRSKTLNPSGYVAEECEIHQILGRNTAYCILTNTYKAADGMVDTSIAGYAFADIEMSMNNNLEDVAVATTFDEAYYQYQGIIARVSQDSDLSDTQSDIQIIGTVQSNAWVRYGTEAGSFLISVITDVGQTHWLLAKGDSLNAAAAKPGDRVVATCYKQAETFLTVRYIRIEGVPDLDQK